MLWGDDNVINQLQPSSWPSANHQGTCFWIQPQNYDFINKQQQCFRILRESDWQRTGFPGIRVNDSMKFRTWQFHAVRQNAISTFAPPKKRSQIPKPRGFLHRLLRSKKKGPLLLPCLLWVCVPLSHKIDEDHSMNCLRSSQPTDFPSKKKKLQKIVTFFVVVHVKTNKSDN